MTGWGDGGSALGADLAAADRPVSCTESRLVRSSSAVCSATRPSLGVSRFVDDQLAQQRTPGRLIGHPDLDALARRNQANGRGGLLALPHRRQRVDRLAGAPGLQRHDLQPQPHQLGPDALGESIVGLIDDQQHAQALLRRGGRAATRQADQRADQELLHSASIARAVPA